MALMWCEARCSLMKPGVECRETSKGAFGMKEATRRAKDDGWKIVRNDWVCPKCLAYVAKRIAEFEATRT